MRRRLPAALLAAAAVLTAAPAAHAAVPHTVAPGETLWSIAAANNLYTGALAAYNGLSPEAQVTLGSTIMVPSAAEALPKVNEAIAAGAPQPSGVVIPSQPAAAQPAAAPSGPPPAGAYTVRAGDTFSSLAARSGVTAEQVAGVNGLDVNAPLIEGTAIKLPPASAPAQAPQPAPQQTPQATPTPTATRVSAGDVQTVAAQNGVPGSLAAAIAWQESGFNNGMVSSANARGVMQVMPGTWDWVQRNLAQRRLDPASATDNVHAGTLYLSSLLEQAGGDPELAAAGYYQGPASVREIGMLPETRQYVNNVMALRSRFGG